MIIVLSSAKTMGNKISPPVIGTDPVFNKEANSLVQLLKKKKVAELMSIMDISEKLAVQNLDRFRNFSPKAEDSTSIPAIYAFRGEVYVGLQAEHLTGLDLDFAQEHLRIFSGLYGYLRPLDMIIEYRLEISTVIEMGKNKNLYAFWKDKLSTQLNNDLRLSGSDYLINLASIEYFKVLDLKKVKARVVNIHFFEVKNGKRTFNSFNAKKARGLMAHFAIKNKCTGPEALKGFNEEGYLFDAASSGESELVFVRGAL